MDILSGILTIILVIASLLLILVVLMQRGSANGGLGAAMGGGAAESAFGAETNNVLTSFTKKTAIVFFVLAFGLYLLKLYVNEQNKAEDINALPEFESNETPAAPADASLSAPAETEALVEEAEPAVPAAE